MHSYSVDFTERTKITIFLFITSIAMMWGITVILKQMQVTTPWWITTPSALTIFGLIYYLFDRHLWKLRILRKLNLIKTPNLNGSWEGTLTTSYEDEEDSEHEIELDIYQNWTNISISLTTDSSKSHSQGAMISRKNPNDIDLVYIYQNEPEFDSKDTMYIHKGTTELSYDPDKDTLEGGYYTGPGRGNCGTFKLKRNKQSLIDRISSRF